METKQENLDSNWQEWNHGDLTVVLEHNSTYNGDSRVFLEYIFVSPTNDKKMEAIKSLNSFRDHWNTNFEFQMAEVCTWQIDEDFGIYLDESELKSEIATQMINKAKEFYANTKKIEYSDGSKIKKLGRGTEDNAEDMDWWQCGNFEGRTNFDHTKEEFKVSVVGFPIGQDHDDLFQDLKGVQNTLLRFDVDVHIYRNKSEADDFRVHLDVEGGGLELGNDVKNAVASYFQQMERQQYIPLPNKNIKKSAEIYKCGQDESPKIYFEKNLDSWFQGLDFIEMEKITGYKPYDFSAEDGYQEFVDACETYWNNLLKEDKLEYYKKIGPNGFDLPIDINQEQSESIDRHFEFTGETKIITRECFNLNGSSEVRDITLHRIRLTESIDNGDDLLFAGQLGGWIEKAENIEGIGWVGGEAMVYHNACVCDQSMAIEHAEIKDSAITADSATVGQNAVISHQGYVGGHSFVGEHATISNKAKVEEHAEITGYVRICGSSEIRGESTIEDHVVVHNSVITGKITIIDHVEVHDSVIEGKCMIEGNVKIIDGSRVENSDFSENVIVKGNAVVRDSNIGSETIIDGAAVIEKCVLIHGIFDKNKTYRNIDHTKNSIVVENQTLLLTKEQKDRYDKGEMTRVGTILHNGKKCVVFAKKDDNGEQKIEYKSTNPKQINALVNSKLRKLGRKM